MLAYLSFECLDDELETGRLHRFDALLDDVVTVLDVNGRKLFFFVTYHCTI